MLRFKKNGGIIDIAQKVVEDFLKSEEDEKTTLGSYLEEILGYQSTIEHTHVWITGVCNTCGKICEHKNIDDKTGKCEICGYLMGDDAEHIHDWNHHTDIAEPSVCTICNMRCSHSGHITSSYNHSGLDECHYIYMNCTNCSKSLATSSELCTDDDDDFTCDKCGGPIFCYHRWEYDPMQGVESIAICVICEKKCEDHSYYSFGYFGDGSYHREIKKCEICGHEVDLIEEPCIDNEGDNAASGQFWGDGVCDICGHAMTIE